MTTTGNDVRSSTVTARTYAGLFFVALATLMYQILLTRIFSVTMFYHFAFAAVSLAMFGMTAGALVVYLRPHWFTPERRFRQLAIHALLFAVTMIASFLTQAIIPFRVHPSVVGIYALALTFVVVTVPFVFAGIAVTIALTRFPGRVGRLYAADLVGAALGCILIVYLLDITDGPTAVIAVGTLAGVGRLVVRARLGVAAAGDALRRRDGAAAAGDGRAHGARLA